MSAAMTSYSQIDERLVSKLRERGLRVTSQRLLIHRTLCAREQHMTAEQVLAAVSEGLPGVSLPTVYATLDLLEELGLTRRLATGGGAVLFDSRVEPHAHAICRRCGVTMDLEAPPASSRAAAQASESGFVPDHAQLVIWGLCERCAASTQAA
jgi:Fur family ferric uptake transcriptional regulator/Fur family peroxide stress response transcriptional regulator